MTIRELLESNETRNVLFLCVNLEGQKKTHVHIYEKGVDYIDAFVQHLPVSRYKISDDENRLYVTVD